MSELGNSFPPPECALLVLFFLRLKQYEVDCKVLTCRDEDSAAAHYASHLLASIAPPFWRRRNVVAQMSLSLVLDVEREDVV